MDCFLSQASLTHPIEANLNRPQTNLDRNALLSLLQSYGKQKSLQKGRKLHTEILLHKKEMLHNDIYISNALISMYVKCGALDDAKEAFDEIRMRNVVSWNTLISGYVRGGLYGEALNLFQKMRELCFHPNAITLACILKACANTGSLHMGEEMHKEVLKLGLLGKNIVVGTALVDMYAKCGVLGKAQEVFDKLIEKDVVSWNALIVGYIQHGLPQEAINCFVRMRAENFSPNEATFTCVLKASGTLGSIGMGEEIHTEVLKKHLLEKNVELGNALVDMYGKCGRLDKAQEAFNSLSLRNVVTWNALVSGYSRHGFGEEALKRFREMRDEGVFPDKFTFSCILKACGTVGSLKMGEEIHVEIRRQGLLEKDVVICTALMDMYAKCGVVSKVQEVFDEFPIRSVVSWNTLIAAYAQHGLWYEALNFYKCMRDDGFSPNAATFSCILKVCGNIKSLELGESIHDAVRKDGSLKRNCFVGTSLVDMYAKCGVLGKAQEVFDKLLDRDVVSWNALISGYSQQGCNTEAINCFLRMQDENVAPNEVTFVCILNACGSMRSLELGEEIHEKMCEQGLYDKNIVLNNALVDMYVKCCMLEKAQKVFDDLLVRNIATWNALIAGYAKHGLYDEVLSCFRQMQDNGLSPNAFTFSSILKACGNAGSLEIGELIHMEIRNQGLLEKDVVLCTSLLDMYSKCGMLEKAQEVFDQLPIRNVASWTALMSGYCQAGQPKKVLKLLNKMTDEGIEPDVVTFVVVLSAYVHAGLVEDGQMVFDDIDRVYCHMPTLEHYSCMVDLFSRAGHFDKAIAAIEKVPVSNRLSLWLSLLGACSKWGNLAIGKLAFQQSIYLDEKCNAAYISMGNIYVAAGMHVEPEDIDFLGVKSERTLGHHLWTDRSVYCAFVDYG